MATTYYAPRETSSNIGAQPPIHYQLPFRVACKGLPMTGRPCLAGGGHRLGPVPGNLLPPLLLTKLVSPLFISCACVSNRQVLVQLACVSPTASPKVACTTPIKTLLWAALCIRLRAPRLLRPSYESPFDAMGPLKLACVSAA